MKSSTAIRIIVALIIIFIFAWAGYVAGVASATPDIILKKDAEYNSIISSVLGLIENEYFMVIDDKDYDRLIDGAISGITQVFHDEPYNDRFTNFYDSELYSQLQAETTGEYAGIGVLMGITVDLAYPEIAYVFPDTPAMEADLVEGDVITHVDSEDSYNVLLPEIATRIKGKPGSEVTLTIFRPSTGDSFDVTLTRKNVTFSSVTETKMLDNAVGYVKITNFALGTVEDFKLAVEELEQDGMEALVLDLRNNSGGLFDACIELANLFLKSGEIVQVYSRGELIKTFEVDPNVAKYNFPLVVLANHNSASASEILVGALKDHQRATIVGESTYGKGVIQAVHPIEYAVNIDEETKNGKNVGSAKSAIAITIGKYLTPSGSDIHGEGIDPNVWYDFNNRLKNDETLKEYQRELDDLIEQLRNLRAKQMTYLRSFDAIVEESKEIAIKKINGEEIAEVPQLKLENENHEPLSKIDIE